jgi:hypothetical protein
MKAWPIFNAVSDAVEPLSANGLSGLVHGVG